MDQRVAIFSADTIRGNIIVRKLSREGFTPLLLDCAAVTAAVVATERPLVFVFDITNCIPDELHTLRRCCESLLRQAVDVVVLGDSALEPPWTVNRANVRFLSNPLDPEALTAAVTSCFATSIFQINSGPDLHPHTLQSLQPDVAETIPTVDLETQLIGFLRLR